MLSQAREQSCERLPPRTRAGWRPHPETPRACRSAVPRLTFSFTGMAGILPGSALRLHFQIRTHVDLRAG